MLSFCSEIRNGLQNCKGPNRTEQMFACFKRPSSSTFYSFSMQWLCCLDRVPINKCKAGILDYVYHNSFPSHLYKWHESPYASYVATSVIFLCSLFVRLVLFSLQILQVLQAWNRAIFTSELLFSLPFFKTKCLTTEIFRLSPVTFALAEW